MKKQSIWVFQWRKSVHYWWSYILFSPECKELTSMLDPLLYRWGVPPVVIRCVHWTMQMWVLQTWIKALGLYIVMARTVSGRARSEFQFKSEHATVMNANRSVKQSKCAQLLERSHSHRWYRKRKKIKHWAIIQGAGSQSIFENDNSLLRKSRPKMQNSDAINGMLSAVHSSDVEDIDDSRSYALKAFLTAMYRRLATVVRSRPNQIAGPGPKSGPARKSESRGPENGVSRWRRPNSEIYSQNHHFGLVYDMIYQFLGMETKNYKFGMFCQQCHPSVASGDADIRPRNASRIPTCHLFTS